MTSHQLPSLRNTWIFLVDITDPGVTSLCPDLCQCPLASSLTSLITEMKGNMLVKFRGHNCTVFFSRLMESYATVESGISLSPPVFDQALILVNILVWVKGH